jgi:hypothetical protein
MFESTKQRGGEMTKDETLAHSLKLQFGLAPIEPNAGQLQAIKKSITAIGAAGKRPTQQDWHTTVAAICPSVGRYKYAGIDNSDLNTLLALANQSIGGQS